MTRDYKDIPDRTLETIGRYVKYGCRPGSFVDAVLRNDLTAAVGRADDENLYALPAICLYVYNQIPGDCWGTREIVDNWVGTEKR